MESRPRFIDQLFNEIERLKKEQEKEKEREKERQRKESKRLKKIVSKNPLFSTMVKINNFYQITSLNKYS